MKSSPLILAPAACASSNHIALLTPPERGAIATLAVRGPDAVGLVAAIFEPAGRRKLPEQTEDSIAFGRWGAGGEEVVVACVGEREVHIHCHGGHAAADAIIASLEARGCSATNWQTWLAATECDPIAAAAREALAAATTELSAAILCDQYRGALRAAVDVAIDLLAREDPAALDLLAMLVRRAQIGARLVGGWKVMLAGQPNVGKSRLLNALLGYERAIVFDQPGTTRDVLSARTALGGWPIELADAAGLRATGDPLEAAGVALARQTLERADLVLVVCDATQPWNEADAAILASYPAALLVVNKFDLLAGRDDARLTALLAAAGAGEFATVVSAATGYGLDELADKIVASFAGAAPGPAEAMPFTVEQASDLAEAHQLALREKMSAAAFILLNRRAWRIS